MSHNTFPEEHPLFRIRERWLENVNKGRWEDALAIIDEGIASTQTGPFPDKFRPYLFNMRGSTYARLKQWRQAVRWYIKSLRIDRRRASTWNFLSRSLRNLGKHKWADKCHDKINDQDLLLLIEISEGIRGDGKASQ